MPDNIINLDAHRKNKPSHDFSRDELIERMAEIEDVLEQMDEWEVTTRDELAEILESLEAIAEETLE